jgi:hypothetical protein
MRKVTLDRTDDALFPGESGAAEVDDAAYLEDEDARAFALDRGFE